MNQQNSIEGPSGTGYPKEGFSLSAEAAVRREVRYTAEANADGAMTAQPFREVASLVLEEISAELTAISPTPQGVKRDYALGA